MAISYKDPKITRIPNGLGPTWGNEQNNRLIALQTAIRAMRSDMAVSVSALFGPGRVLGEGTQGQPSIAAGLNLRLTPQNGLPARYIAKGEPFQFDPNGLPYAIACPANRTNCYGFLSPDPDNETLLLVLDADWLDSPTPAVIREKLAQGKPCLGKVTTNTNAIVSYDPSVATTLRSLGELSMRQDDLDARLTALETGGVDTGGGTGTGGGTPGPQYASLQTFERPGDFDPADERKTNVVIRDLFQQAKAYADEQVSTGGTKLVNPPLDQIFDHIGYIHWVLSKLWPEASAGAEVSQISLNRWGDGTNGSPNLRGPSTGLVNSDTLEIDPS